jgi:hypothetical protein
MSFRAEMQMVWPFAMGTFRNVSFIKSSRRLRVRLLSQ